MDTTDKERLAVNETELRSLKEDLNAIRNQNAELLDRIDTVRSELTRYKGFIGACLFLGGTLISLLDIFKDFLFKH